MPTPQNTTTSHNKNCAMVIHNTSSSHELSCVDCSCDCLPQKTKTVDEIAEELMQNPQFQSSDPITVLSLLVQTLTTERRQAEEPMGVSQWKKYGKKYGYWDFFAEEAVARAVKQIENKYENCPQCIGLREEFRKELVVEIKNLCTHFPVRESDEFDDGRLSMQREVLEILTTPKQ